MPAIALAKGRSKRREDLLIRPFNMVFEGDPTNLDDGFSIMGRPGLQLLGNTGVGFIAGMIRREDGNDSVVGVTGEFFFAVNPQGAISLGGGGISGTERVRMATDGANTMIARNGTLRLKPQSGVATVVAMPDGLAVADVVFLAGRFWIATKTLGRVYFTVPGEVTIDPLNYFTAESSPDAVIGLGVDNDQLNIFGRSSIEYWFPTADPDLPAQRIEGRRAPAGLASVFSLATTDVGLCWVGDDGIVYRSGSLPVPISTPDVAEAIKRGRAKINNDDPATTLNGWSFTMDQHVYYLLDVPGEGTLVYDFLTGQWSDFGSSGLPLMMVGCAAKLSAGRWVAGGTFDSKLQLISADTYKDDDRPLVRRFSGLTRVTANQKFANVQVNCSVGGGDLSYPTDNPKLAMQFSDDDGKTWLGWSFASLQRQGVYNKRPTFKNLRGMRPGTRIWEWRMADPIPFTAHAASYNEGVI